MELQRVASPFRTGLSENGIAKSRVPFSHTNFSKTRDRNSAPFSHCLIKQVLTLGVGIVTEEAIFAAALECATPEARRALVKQACAGDTKLEGQIAALLQAHDHPDSFLQAPQASLVKAMDAPASECTGMTVGPYKLLEQIGEGGMGLVFMAEQTRPVRRRVALKVLKPGLETRQVVARFEAERQALAIMDHPHIAKVFDAGVTDSGRPYFVMELVRGVPLTQYCDERRLSTRQRLELFVAVCQAVQHAHQKGIIHRDLKPSNVLVTQHGTVAVPKVIDFGIAKATSQPLTERTLFTNFSQMLGTPLYMSPEQAEMSSQDVDTRSDVYSLGVLLYELLTGTTPFESTTLKKVGLDEMRRLIREEEPPSPSRRLSTLSAQASSTISERRDVDGRRLGQVLRGELDWIVMKALEKDRDRRYESANSLAADLQRYLSDEAVEAGPPSAGYRLRKYVRRNRQALVPAAIVVAALVTATAVSTWQAVRAREAQGLAEANSRAARQAVDQMYLQVAEKWLDRQPLMDQVRKDFIMEVLRFYQEFSLQEPRDHEARFEIAMANQRAGAILNYAFAEKAQAQEALLRARDALQHLAAECPDQPEYVFELARSYGKLAHTKHLGRAGNNLEEEDLRQAIRLLERLIARFPAEPRYRAALALNLTSLCNPLLSANRLPEVKETAQQALALLEPLIHESPKPEYLTTMAAAYQHLAHALRREGAVVQAIASLRKGIACLERLAKDGLTEPEYQHGLRPFDWHMLARCYRDLGMLLRRVKDFEGAEKAAQRSVRIYVRISADFPDMPDFKEALADSRRHLGELHQRVGKLPEAEAEFREASKVEEMLRGGSGKLP
jgi:serine/threonine protein kinase